MKNANLTYKVTGRYMTGSNVIGYHLVGEDGSQLRVSKEKAIYMIVKGNILNLRVQTNGEDMIIRGKGINLNKLPVFDTNKSEIRKGNSVKNLGQLNIYKRVMYGNTCIGYVVKDVSGNELKLKREKVIELATSGLIGNAKAERVFDKNTGKTRIVLRGEGCNIKDLPKIMIDSNGKEISDSSVRYMRAIRMKRGGIIYNRASNTKVAFKTGDYIVCCNGGELIKLDEQKYGKRIKRVNISNTNNKDTDLSKLQNYPIELFGAKAQVLNAGSVSKWPLITIN